MRTLSRFEFIGSGVFGITVIYLAMWQEEHGYLPSLLMHHWADFWWFAYFAYMLAIAPYMFTLRMSRAYSIYLITIALIGLIIGLIHESNLGPFPANDGGFDIGDMFAYTLGIMLSYMAAIARLLVLRRHRPLEAAPPATAKADPG